MKQARLIYVMDPMCSWCWGFYPVLVQLAAQAKSAELALHVVVGGLRQEQMPLTGVDRQRLLGYWQQVAEVSQQPFADVEALPAGFIYDTTAACKALVTARELDSDKVLALLHSIQYSFYAQSLDVTQPAQLVELAVQAGFDRQRFAEHYHSDAVAQRTQQDFAWAQSLGVSGFPTVLLEREGQLALLTNGYQPLQPLAELFARWLERANHA